MELLSLSLIAIGTFAADHILNEQLRVSQKADRWLSQHSNESEDIHYED